MAIEGGGERRGRAEGGGRGFEGRKRCRPRVIRVKVAVITDSNTRVKNTAETVCTKIRWWLISSAHPWPFFSLTLGMVQSHSMVDIARWLIRYSYSQTCRVVAFENNIRKTWIDYPMLAEGYYLIGFPSFTSQAFDYKQKPLRRKKSPDFIELDPADWILKFKSIELQPRNDYQK